MIKKTKIKNQLQYSWRKNKTFQLSHQLKKKLKLLKHQKQLRHQKQILKLKSNQQMLKKLLRKMQQKYLLLLLLQIYLHQLQQRVFLLHKVNLRRNCNSRRKQIRNLMKKANQSLQTNHLQSITLSRLEINSTNTQVKPKSFSTCSNNNSSSIPNFNSTPSISQMCMEPQFLFLIRQEFHKELWHLDFLNNQYTLFQLNKISKCLCLNIWSSQISSNSTSNMSMLVKRKT